MSNVEQLQAQLNESQEQLAKAKAHANAELIERTITVEATKQGAHSGRLIHKFIDGKPMVRENDNGEQYVFVALDDGTPISVADAVARCREQNDNLFTARKAPPVPAAEQRVDVTQLSHEQYRQLRRENPKAVGLLRRYIERRGR